MACQNLLAQMLLPSPEQRITVAEILRHPWFLRDLPPGTELVNERLQHDVHARCVALFVTAKGDEEHILLRLW